MKLTIAFLFFGLLAINLVAAAPHDDGISESEEIEQAIEETWEQFVETNDDENDEDYDRDEDEEDDDFIDGPLAVPQSKRAIARNARDAPKSSFLIHNLQDKLRDVFLHML